MRTFNEFTICIYNQVTEALRGLFVTGPDWNRKTNGNGS